MHPRLYFKSFERIIQSFDHSIPLHLFLKQFFRNNKQMGAKDRKEVSGLVYSYFRLGKVLQTESLEIRLCVAELLCKKSLSPFVQYIKPEWLNENIAKDVISFLKQKGYNIELKDVFPFLDKLSVMTNKDFFVQNHWEQPHVFIRLDEAQQLKTLETLQAHSISYKSLSNNCLVLPNNVNLTSVFGNNMPFEIQDWSSQQTGNFFNPNVGDIWWDCCAASGGKSLLLHSICPQIKLYVSDIRQNILYNLEQRFKNNNINNYQSIVLDTILPLPKLLPMFDGIVLDAPCSGSGTWSRAPENLCYFQENQIVEYQTLQRNILKNVISKLKPEKPLIYITCSVYKAENEENTQYAQSLGMHLEEEQLIEGYFQNADTMFVARLRKK